MSQNHGRDAPAINSTKKSSLFEVPFGQIPVNAEMPKRVHPPRNGFLAVLKRQLIEARL
jgi:hypothetical protein